nr:ubiquitin E3 ligase ICP0 [Human alphaherpesvirus 3]
MDTILAGGSGTSDASDNTCTICMSTVSDLGKTMPCLHDFCFVCIRAWTYTSVQCPLCRCPVQSILHKIVSDTSYKEYEVHPSDDDGFSEPSFEDSIDILPGDVIDLLPPSPGPSRESIQQPTSRSSREPIQSPNPGPLQSSAREPTAESPSDSQQDSIQPPTRDSSPGVTKTCSTASFLRKVFFKDQPAVRSATPVVYGSIESAQQPRTGGQDYRDRPVSVGINQDPRTMDRLPFRATDRGTEGNARFPCYMQPLLGWLDDQLAELYQPEIVEPTKMLILNYIGIYGRDEAGLKTSLRCLLHDSTGPFVTNMLFLLDRCTDPTRLTMQTWTWKDTAIQLITGPIVRPETTSTGETSRGDERDTRLVNTPQKVRLFSVLPGIKPGSARGAKRRLFHTGRDVKRCLTIDLTSESDSACKGSKTRKVASPQGESNTPSTSGSTSGSLKHLTKKSSAGKAGKGIPNKMKKS